MSPQPKIADRALMNELDDALLNEYLDGALDAETRQAVEIRLANDPAARARLAALESLFATFDEMEEVPLNSDLSVSVMTAIGAERSETTAWWLRLLPLIQLVAAALLIAFFWVTLREYWDSGRANLASLLPPFQLPDLMIAELVDSWLTAVGQAMADFSPPINLATNQWLAVIGVALVIWLLGNRLLFTNSNGGSHG